MLVKMDASVAGGTSAELVYEVYDTPSHPIINYTSEIKDGIIMATTASGTYIVWYGIIQDGAVTFEKKIANTATVNYDTTTHTLTINYTSDWGGKSYVVGTIID